AELERRAVSALDPALDAGVTVYNGRIEVLTPELRSSIGSPALAELLVADDRAALERHLRSRVERADVLDVIVLMSPDGGVLGSAKRAPRFLDGFVAPEPVQIARSKGEKGDGFVRTGPIPVRIAGEGVVATAVGATWIDSEILEQPVQQEIDLSLAHGDTIVASTLDIDRATSVDIESDDRFEAALGDGGAIGESRPLGGGMRLVASTPSGPLTDVSRRLLLPMLGVLALALFATSGLALLLARHLTQPLEELSAGALAIAEGRFDHQIPVRSRDEVGQLAIAFNEMRDRLASSYTQLSSSRDQLQRAVRRVGETLRSTHDMNQMLGSILNTAADAVDADAAVLWRFTPTRDGLQASLAVGLDGHAKGTVPVGHGIVGFVAERAQPVFLPSQGGPRPARGEPPFAATIAVPIYSEDRIAAVLAAYRHDEKRPFGPEDLETVVFLAEQGGVAIENVLLHEEAQRLSLTDGLTGTWNRRYFQMQFRQVLATATRFDRTFSVLMLDLDHFKVLNDTYGHQRGDAVLVEFAQRVKETLREVDTFARYGGEEFIVLLPETDEVGAHTTGEKIREEIRSQPFGALGEEPVPVTVSIGVASYPRHGDRFDQLVESADKALYAAKQGGRDRVMVAEPPPPNLHVAK
ncbi:MAG: diguanylate cyclase, partial [Actinomycetota bacterium]|nr:diguanylate cyclase [Actinomycetota bacterium]